MPPSILDSYKLPPGHRIPLDPNDRRLYVCFALARNLESHGIVNILLARGRLAECVKVYDSVQALSFPWPCEARLYITLKDDYDAAIEQAGLVKDPFDEIMAEQRKAFLRKLDPERMYNA